MPYETGTAGIKEREAARTVLKISSDENGQGMRQPVRSSGRQAKTRKRTDTSFRPERELQRLRAVRRGYSVAGRTGRRSRRRLREGPRPVGRRNGLGATDSLSRMRVAGRAFGSGRNPSETFRRLSARRPRRIGERLGRQHPPVFPVQPGAERRSISSLCSSDGKRFQLHARNARQSAEGLLGFFSRSDVPVRGCVSDAWPEAPGRCEKPAETTARHRLIRNSDYLAFTTKRCRSGNGRIADALPDGSATDSRFRTSISKRASK